MSPIQASLLYCSVAFGIGCVTGLAEILPRYRDDPLKAAQSGPGIIYWLANGLLSVIAFGGVLLAYRHQLGLFENGHPVHLQLIKATLMSGFGAMALIRAKVFKVTLSNGNEVSVGPEHMINVLFDSANAYIAKTRAWDRTDLVEGKFRNVRFAPLRDRVITLALTARQSLSLAEQAALGEAMGRITTDTIPEFEKSLRAGYLLLDYVGESFLSKYQIPPEWQASQSGTPKTIPPPTSPTPAPGETEIPIA